MELLRSCHRPITINTFMLSLALYSKAERQLVEKEKFMRTITVLFSAIALTLTAYASVASAKVIVEYQNPDKFADVKDRQFKSSPEKNSNLIQLKSWLEKRAANWVADDRTLKVQFQDIDLAGEYEPWQPSQLSDIRIVKDLYPPKLKFHFQLLGADNAIISEGDRELKDLSFMMQADHNSSESMRFEKRMLEDWLRKEFPKN